MTQLRELCDQARRELGALGELGRGLVGAIDAVEAASAGRGPEVLAEPAFALEVLMVAGEGTGAATVGRVLDFLRQRAGAPAIPSIGRVTVAQAIEAYERGGLALMATGTGHTYRTWTRRLVAALGAADVAAVTAGDLTDVIAAHATPGNGRRGRGRSAEENAVAAFRHLWGYLVEKGYAQANVAARLRKPSRGEPARRAIRPEEAALFRQLVRAGRDPLLRRRPVPASPEGTPTGRRRIEELFARLGRAAPDLFLGGGLSLHSYRHALATFVDARWGRAVTRAVLGHTSRRSPTDYYVHVDRGTLIEVLAAYEAHLLGAAAPAVLTPRAG